MLFNSSERKLSGQNILFVFVFFQIISTLNAVNALVAHPNLFRHLHVHVKKKIIFQNSPTVFSTKILDAIFRNNECLLLRNIYNIFFVTFTSYEEP